MRNKQLQLALHHHQAGEIDKAAAIYQQIIAQEPNNANIWHLLGIISAQQKNFTQAKKQIQQAIKLNNQEPSYENSLGNVHKNLNQLSQAHKHYQLALTIQPDYAVAHNSIGNLLLQQDKLSAAKKYYQKAVQLQPDYADAHYNLSLIFLKQRNQAAAIDELNATLKYAPEHCEAHNQIAQIAHQKGDYEKAINHYQLALKLDPLNKELFHNLGAIFLEQHNPDTALKYFLRLLQLAPDLDTYYNLAVTYNYLGRIKEAIEYFNKTLEIDPKHLASYHNLGALYLKANNHSAAKQCYQQLLKYDPNNSEVKFILAAINQDKNISHTPSGYVQHLFDQYAINFDQHLTELLDYQAPKLLYQAVIEELNNANKINILDLGCGTGLSGIPFAKHAKQLIGIDLSAKMLEQAKQKKFYTELQQMEITAALKKYQNMDLIIAVDTFVYLGDLNQVIKLCTESLKTNGLLAFTTEICHNSDYHLEKTARFSHNKKYITALATQNNLRILLQHNILLRKQNQQQLQGHLYLLQKQL